MRRIENEMTIPKNNKFKYMRHQFSVLQYVQIDLMIRTRDLFEGH
jgi:hypothetical protein